MKPSVWSSIGAAFSFLGAGFAFQGTHPSGAMVGLAVGSALVASAAWHRRRGR
jgi:ABC-type Fe3+-siderophore transport system permease subunit